MVPGVGPACPHIHLSLSLKLQVFPHWPVLTLGVRGLLTTDPREGAYHQPMGIKKKSWLPAWPSFSPASWQGP